MEKMNYKKVIAIGTIALVAGGVAGFIVAPNNISVEKYQGDMIKSLEEGKQIGIQSVDLEQAKADAIASVDITLDNEQAVTSFLNENEIAYSLAENGQVIITPTPTETPVVFTGYDLDELSLGESVSNVDLIIDDSDLEKLQDKSIEFDDDDYNIHEEVVLTPDVKIAINGYSLFEKELGNSPLMALMDEQSIKYRYVFDDQISKLSVDEDDSLKINFLGKDLEIINIDDNTVELLKGTAVQLNVAETVDGITLLGVAENGDSAVVKFNEITKTIDKGEIEEFGDTEIYLSDVFWGANGYGFANIRYGEDVKETIENGDEYTEDSDWKWIVEVDGEYLKTLGVMYDKKLNEIDEMIAVGDSISLPEDFIKVSFKEIAPTETETYEFDFDNIDYSSVSYDTLHITTNLEDGIVLGNDEVSEAWFDGEVTYFEDDNNDLVVYEGAPTLVYDETESELSYADGIVSIGFDLSFKTTDFQYLGEIEDDSNEAEFWYNGLDISDWDEDVLTNYGTVVISHVDSDEFEIQIPSDKVEATISFE